MYRPESSSTGESSRKEKPLRSSKSAGEAASRSGRSTGSIEGFFCLERKEFLLDVKFSLPGEGITVLFGTSGSGKSTFLRCMAGLEHPSSSLLRVNGSVWQDSDNRIFLPTHHRSIGMVFQEPSLFDHLSVRQNLFFGRKNEQAGQASDSRKTREFDFESVMHRLGLDHFFITLEQKEDEELQSILSMLGIEHLLDRRTAELSGGEMQRVGIARALLRRPQLLLMDEPLSSLDSMRKREILPFLERMHGELTIPILYVTHSESEAYRLADHLIQLDNGRIVRQGDPHQLLHQASAGIDELSAEFEAIVEELEPDGLSRLRVPGGEFFIFSQGTVPGESVRCRILASDVSLSLSRSDDTSILNLLACTVIEVLRSSVPAHVLVRVVLRDGRCELLARITERSCRRLNIVPGTEVWAQVKTVAIGDV